MKDWTITVTVPGHLSSEAKDDLFTHVADAVHLWEPEERPGWDVSVVAGAAEPDPDLVQVTTREGRAIEFLGATAFDSDTSGFLYVYDGDEALATFAPGLWEYAARVRAEER